MTNEEREREIAEVEEEIAYLKELVADYECCTADNYSDALNRILVREQAALAELRRGWKG